jgi:hypothetical protein
MRLDCVPSGAGLDLFVATVLIPKGTLPVYTPVGFSVCDLRNDVLTTGRWLYQ